MTLTFSSPEPYVAVSGPATAMSRLAELDPLRGHSAQADTQRLANCKYRTSFFEGRVGLSEIPPRHREPEHGLEDVDCASLDAASALLRDVAGWRYAEFPSLVTIVHPVTHVQVPAGSLCSNSGNTTLDPPGIFLTVTHPAATAEALVHEMAHHKLLRLGVTPDDGGAFLKPLDEEVYSAAVRRLRPIAAILHAAYSFLHMVEFDLTLLEMRRFEDEARLLLPGNLEVARDTMARLAEHAQPHEEGRNFLMGLERWAQALFEAADGQ